MGEVYRAHDTRLDRDVAINLVPAELAAELLNRWNAYQNAQLVQPANPTLVALTLKLLNKTLDKCSVELGRPTTPRPTVVPQEDGTLKLEYAT